MSDEYKNIPPAQLDIFLKNAEQTANEAAEPVNRALGEVVVKSAEALLEGGEADRLIEEAERLTRTDARSKEVVGAAETFRDQDDIAHNFMQEMESATSGTAEDAEHYANYGSPEDEALAQSQKITDFASKFNFNHKAIAEEVVGNIREGRYYPDNFYYGPIPNSSLSPNERAALDDISHPDTRPNLPDLPPVEGNE